MSQFANYVHGPTYWSTLHSNYGNTHQKKLWTKSFAKKIIMKLAQDQDFTYSPKNQSQKIVKLTLHFSALDDHPQGSHALMWHFHKTKNCNRYLKK